MGETLEHPKNRRNPRSGVKTRSRTGRFVTQWSLVLVALLVAVVLARDWSFKGLGMAELVMLPVLAFLCLWLGIRWYLLGMNWLPLGEVYAGLHLVYYVLPCLNGREDWLQFSQSQRWIVLSGVGVFLVSFQTVYLAVLRRQQLTSESIMIVLRREMSPGALWAMLGVWLVWSLLLQSRLVPNVGNVLNVFRSIAIAFGSLSVVFFFFQIGRRLLPMVQCWLVLGCFTVGLVLNFTSGFLNGSVQWLCAAALAFTLGRKRVPVVILGICAIILLFLQLGKSDYREKYWGEDQNYSVQRVGLVEGYSVWFSAGWHNFWHPSVERESLTKRTSLVQVLGRAMETVPDRQPFLHGQTYLLLPQLMVPRIFWPDKPRGTAATEALGIYIGMQTEENANTTGISMGPLAEAWVNFGWFGLIMAGCCLGALFGLSANISYALSPNQIGWLVAAIFLVYCADLEDTMVETLCSLSTALVMGVFFLLVVSRGTSLRRSKRNSKVLERPQGDTIALRDK